MTVLLDDRFKLRRGTAASLAAVNETPLAGEIVIESDTGLSDGSRKMKIGDGVTPWNSLPYLVMDGASGTTAQYRRGDKTWRDFATDVRGAVLTGLSLASSVVIAATDTVLGALGKLQAQITANLATLTGHTGDTSNPHSVTKTQVGLSNVDNTSDASKPVSTAQAAAIANKFDKSGGTVTGDTTIIGTTRMQRPSVPDQVFETKVDGVGNAFNSYSSPSSAKYLLLNATTDAANTTPTGGGVGVRLTVLGVARWNVFIDAFRPEADNAYDVGAPAARGRVAYFGTGAINTSDAREKTDVAPLTADELAAAADLARAIGTYQWLASIADKSADNARHHAGLTVQRAIEIMQSHGLDPMRYGFICYDEWHETPEQWADIPEEHDDEGNVIREAGRELVQAYRPAGDRYSFRTGELDLWISRGLIQLADEHRAEIDAMKRRLDALEAK